ncbi:hypothetical protein EQP59_02255 [Ornithobacterium rhinotracheale]|uniref:Uncharacterized protein n=1 Tax=Ornithobacterium rhinotracheale TaxID=28251 RepID=A0A410JQ18_ORNRH|nr:hypothetical protein [Ornithobacterium rhinotracheale]QAR30263.1 hypothetical protein EQP59_02255 [Ornithobacterium rhinotracheale]
MKTLYIKSIDGCTDFQDKIVHILSGGIIGVSKISAARILNEIHNTFYNYPDIKKIFKLESNNLKISRISRSVLDNAIRRYNTDIRSMAFAYFLVINDSNTHYVDMTFTYETLNNISTEALNIPNGTKGEYADNHYGGGVNTSYRNGTLSVILLNSKIDIGDFTYAPNNVNYARFSTPAELLSHELLGHGYGRVIGSPTYRHEDAIQMSNLYWRVRGYNNFYRNGNYHGTQIILNKRIANKIPPHFIYH